MINCSYPNCKNQVPPSTVEILKNKLCGRHAHLVEKTAVVHDVSSDDETWGSSVDSDDLSYTSSEPDENEHVTAFYKKMKQIKNVRFTT